MTPALAQALLLSISTLLAMTIIFIAEINRVPEQARIREPSANGTKPKRSLL